MVVAFCMTGTGQCLSTLFYIHYPAFVPNTVQYDSIRHALKIMEIHLEPAN